MKVFVKKGARALLKYIRSRVFVNNKDVNREIQKLLLVFPYGLGNTILANGAIKSLKKAFPSSEFAAICKQSATVELLKILGGFEKLFYYNERSTFREKIKFANLMKVEKFNVVIIFFADKRIKFKFIFFYARIPYRISFDFSNSLSKLFLTHSEKYDKKISEFENNLKLLNPFQIPIERSISFRTKKFHLPKGEINKKRFGIHVGRIDIKKCGWSVQNFAELIILMKERYNAEIYLFGGIEEKENSLYFNKKFGENIVNLIGKTNLEQTIYYISQMDLFISNDTGLMHIAASQDIPLVAIFGPTDLIKNRLIVKDEKKIRIVHLDLPCQPCYPFMTKDTCKHNISCLTGITTNMVIRSVDELFDTCCIFN